MHRVTIIEVAVDELVRLNCKVVPSTRIVAHWHVLDEAALRVVGSQALHTSTLHNFTIKFELSVAGVLRPRRAVALIDLLGECRPAVDRAVFFASTDLDANSCNPLRWGARTGEQTLMLGG